MLFLIHYTSKHYTTEKYRIDISGDNRFLKVYCNMLVNDCKMYKNNFNHNKEYYYHCYFW